MALRIGLLGSSALQNDRHIKPVILQCRTRQEINPKGHWRPNWFLRKPPPNGDVDLLAGSEFALNLGSQHLSADTALTPPRNFGTTTAAAALFPKGGLHGGRLAGN
jgi:hypothetical protein